MYLEKINLNPILSEFKEFNTEYLFKMLENMNVHGILNDPRVMQAMRNIRIEDFITIDMIKTFILPLKLPKSEINENLVKKILMQLFALFYNNRPLPFYNDMELGRSTSAPHMIAIMAQLIDVEPNDKILVLGSKSGYLESIIQDMDEGIELYIIEKVSEIYDITKYNLQRAKMTERVKIYNMDPILDIDKIGIGEFDKIFITGYLEKLPKMLLDKIKIGGMICGPFGSAKSQILLRYFKTGVESYDEEDCGGVIFSPLITDYAEAPAQTEEEQIIG